MFHVTSSDGVSVTVHELAGTPGLPPLLIAHATGFHAHCYVPIARALGHRFHCYALDFRGHGETAPVPDWTVDWSHFGDDAVAVADAIAPNGELVGFDCFHVGRLSGTVGMVWQYTAIDLATSYVWAELATTP